MTGAELRSARKAVGISMAEAARATGTPYRTWQGWEDDGHGGRRTPGIAFAWLKLYAAKGERGGTFRRRDKANCAERL